MALVLQAIVMAGPVGAAPTPPERVKIWTANLNQFADSPMKLVDNIEAQYNRPDFVALSGINAWEMEQFRAELQSRFSDAADYKALHGETLNVADDPASNVALIWDSARFTRLGEERWLDYLGYKDGQCTTVKDQEEANSKYQLAVRFKDTKNNDRSTVVASVHLNRLSPPECHEANMRKLHNQLEVLAATRRLTLVAGDFNMPVRKDDKTCTDANDDRECDRAPEIGPDCWYTQFSVTDPTPGTCEPGASQQDSYVDTAGVEAKTGPAGALCDQWTRGRDYDELAAQPGVFQHYPATDSHEASDYCHDFLDDRGRAPWDPNYAGPNGIRDKNRIDFIWARWEEANGNAITAPVDTLGEATPQVIQASADTDAPRPGDPSVRYSDHRGVHAAVKVIVQ